MTQREERTKVKDLTDREMEVVKLLSLGKTNDEIAKSLDCSPKTVDSHRLNLKKKLGLRNNVEIARHALRLGWVTLD